MWHALPRHCRYRSPFLAGVSQKVVLALHLTAIPAERLKIQVSRRQQRPTGRLLLAQPKELVVVPHQLEEALRIFKRVKRIAFVFLARFSLFYKNHTCSPYLIVLTMQKFNVKFCLQRAPSENKLLFVERELDD